MVEAIHDLYMAGFSVRQIAKALKVSILTVEEVLEG